MEVTFLCLFLFVFTTITKSEEIVDNTTIDSTYEYLDVENATILYNETEYETKEESEIEPEREIQRIKVGAEMSTDVEPEPQTEEPDISKEIPELENGQNSESETEPKSKSEELNPEPEIENELDVRNVSEPEAALDYELEDVPEPKSEPEIGVEDKSEDISDQDHPDETSSREPDTLVYLEESSCDVSQTLKQMNGFIQELTKEIESLKSKMFEICLDKSNTTEVTEIQTEEDETIQEPIVTETPTPEIICGEPFDQVANGCFYILYHPSDWRNWGDANAFCQSLGGTLASPEDGIDDLKEFLKNSFSNVFWVGAKREMTNGKFSWLNGKEFNAEDWAEGEPAEPSKFCVFLEFFSGYKGVSHYCGEKFPFVCEERKSKE